MGFKFRYEALLKYRGHLKEKAEIDLARAQNRLRQNRGELSGHEEALKETEKCLDSDLRSSISSDMLLAYSGHIISLKAKIETQKVEIYHSEKRVREKLDFLQKKTVQYKIIEKLKEKDFKKWHQKQSSLEQKELDEMAVVRYGKDFL